MERLAESVAMDARSKNTETTYHQTLPVVAMAALGSGLAPMDCTTRMETTSTK